MQRQYAFSIDFFDQLSFSSRLISDGTLRLLALLTLINDRERKGTLCFEEPENGVHEGRVPMLVEILRDATSVDAQSRYGLFQILINTHSPKVMNSLLNQEIVASDTVFDLDPVTKTRVNRTRMRSGLSSGQDLIDPERYLTRSEVERLLQKSSDAA